MITKWSVLEARLEKARADVKEREEYLESLSRTPCELNCAGCGEFLATEEDFAKHFVLENEVYLNLGNCPNSKRKAATGVHSND